MKNKKELEEASLLPTPKEEVKEFRYMTATSKSYQLLKEISIELKKEETKAEKIMWEYLKNKKIGHKIRRQHIVDNFIADFICLRKMVIIEIDGEVHLKQKEHDELRTNRLNDLGYEVIRFTNAEVFDNPELVVSVIKLKLD